MDAVFLNSDLSDIYNGTVVNGFTQGSVIVNFTINLIRAPTAPTVTGSTTLSSGVGSIDDQINSVRGQVEVSVKEIIQIADDNGDLTTLGVDSTTLSVTDVSVDVETITVTETPATTIAPSTRTPDEEPPVLVCPDDVTAETEAGAAFGIISWTSPTATDNSGEVTVETDFVPGQLPIGSRNITVTATDAAGNTAECVIVATVVDIEAPVAICPEDITRNTDLGQAYATISWSSPRGTDNSGTISSINADPREGQFAIGSHVITVTVVDPAGLEGQCTFDTVVQDNEVPTVECPATIEVSTDVSSPSSIVTWTVLGQDNSGSVPSLSSSPSSGGSFAIGSTTVVVTALDQSGNMGQCSFNVIVFDSEPPVITCPASIIQATDLGSSSATVTWQATAADNSGDPPTITSSPEPGMLSFGTLTVVAMATDSSENTASCNFTVQIVDEEAPSITCPDNITVATDVGASSAIVTWAGPFASDNSGQATAVTDISLGLWTIGIQTVTGTAVDGSGNEAQCTFWVNVQDLENPMVLCPADITSELAADPVTWDATATDNSEMIANLTSSPSPSDVVLGTNTVTVIAMDPSGNKAECSFVVTLTDTTAPTITCPDDVSGTLAAGQSSVSLAWVEPSATDLSGDVTVTASHSLGDYSIGQVNVTASATDSSGNQASCFFLVTVTDMQDPTISSCPPSQSVNTDSGLATAVVSWTPPTASDNSGSVSLTSDYSSGNPFPIGSTRVTYTATDGSGNSVMTCTFDIAVHDNEIPVISGCPSPLSVNTDSGVASWNANWTEPTASDNSGVQTLTSDYYPGYPLPIGSTTVTYTSTDVIGNSETCMFVVTVIDKEMPLISGCPSSIYVDADSGKSTGTAIWAEPTASDNSGFQTLTSDYNSGNSFPVGTTNVTYISTDDAGNTDTCSFDVTVIGNSSAAIVGSLVIAGTFSAELTDSTSELYQSTAANLVTGFDAIFEPLGSQYIGTSVNGFSNGSIIAGFTVNLESLSATDGTNPATSTTQMISNSINNGIEGGSFGSLSVVPGSSSIPKDTEAPMIRCCPSLLPFSTDSGQSVATAIWTLPKATDNFGVIETITSNYKPGDSFLIGSTMVTYTFTDGSRNNASCNFNVTVIDDENPVISGCPGDQYVTSDIGNATSVVTWTPPTATDNSGNQTLTSTSGPGDYFLIGNNTITYNATDDAGNTESCTFFVVVSDNENPVIFGCPSDQNVNTDSGSATAVVTWRQPRATDNSGSQTLTSTGNPGDYFPIGNKTVTYNATDDAGNTETCTFFVVVSDTENPVISGCPSVQSVDSDIGNATSVVTWTPPTATDNSGNQTLTSTSDPGDYFPIGNNTVTYRSTDGAGNTEACTFFVVVSDNENPVISGCPSDQNVTTDIGNATAVVTWTAPTATDNSGNQTLTSSHNPGDYFPLGNNTVTYYASDDAGNTETCTFFVVVSDNEIPVISGCPSDQNVTTDIGNATAVVTWTAPTATDNSGNQTLTSSHNPGDYFPLGNNTVTYYASDDAGNTETCTFFVVVSDNEIPVISGCPSDQNVTTDIGNATAVVTWTAPTATDNSGNQTLTSSHNPGDYFPLGNNTVTYYASDDAGNTETCTFFVVVSDNEIPVISGCPSDQNVTTDIGNATAVVTWTAPTATDNSGNQTLTSSHNPGDYFPLGNNTVTYYASDDAGNTETCTFFVVVSDNEIPVISGCPSDQNVTTDIGNATAVVTWTAPTATDNSGNQTLTSSHNPGDYFPLGNNTVTYYASDDAGNTETCTFFVVVSDNEIPVISGCPSDQNVTTDIGNATAVVTWTAPTATDNSGNQTLTSSHNPGDYFPLGNNTVTYYASDDAGNTETCTFFVVVSDNEIPVISGCPSDQNVTTDIGNATAVVTWTAPTATDNSGNQTLTSSHNPGDYFPLGNNTVTYYASDDAGNTETCTFFVVVSDNEIPVISGCPSDQNVTTDIGNATAVVTWTAPTATDNSGNQTLTSSHNPGDYFPLGNNTVTYYASDDAGNTETCTFFVVVSDNEIPVISGCPSDQNVTTDIGNATAVVTWTAPTATDNSGNQTLTSSHNPGDYFPLGNNTVTYYASDDAGNTETCTFFVVVSDNEIPVISGCPSDQNVTTDIGNATAVVTWTAPTATDNSGNQTLTSSHNPGDYFPLGNNTVTYYASDDAGNTETCTFFVVVSDNEIPVISGCPSDQNVTTDIGNATAVVTWTAPTATDNSGNQTLTSSHNPGDYFPLGNNTVTYYASDDAGNTETCTFFVVVSDNEIPVISGCPSDQNVTTDIGNATAVVTWTAPTATDNSGNQTLTSSHNPGDYFPLGNNTVTYYASDDAGNTETCTFFVVVSDNEIPVISGCPSDQNVTTDIGNATAVVTWTAPTATDNSGNQTLTSSHNPGDYFPLGNNTVTYYASDDAGNTETCTFFVVVSDNEIPVISGCPSDQNVTTDIGNATAVVTWTAPTATDNSGNQTLTSSHNPGDYFPLGNNTVTYYASDDAGNTETCTFFVVVSDNEIPVISGCPSDQNVTTDIGNATAVVTWTAPTATDNSGNQTLTSSHNPGDYFPLGNNTVTYYASDDAGNTETCTFFVVVSDNEIPVISGCPSDQNVTTDIGNATAVVTWTAPTATDNSGNQTLTSSHNPGDYFPLGNNTVTYYASDDAGNTETCTFFVVVSDNEIPVISGCPSDQNVTTDIGNATAVVTWTAPTATDNSGNQTLTSSHNPGDYFPLGNNTVTYYASDDAGNTETCTFFVVVSDNEIPVISGCPSDQNVTTDIGNDTAVVTWTPPTATDNSGNQTLTSTNNPGDYFPIGNNTVTYYARDYAGNTEACSFFVVVSDNENPVISGCPSDQNVTRGNGNETALVIWTPPTATDNSGNQTLTSTSNPGDYFPIGNNTVTYTSTDGAGNTETCIFILVVTDPMVNISLSVNEMYNLTSPGYPSNYDINLNLQWTVLAPSDYRVMISVTDFRSEAGYDYLHIGGGLTFDPDTWMVRFSGTYDSPTEVLLPGREAWILFFSDYSTTNVGFVLEITTSSEAAGECGASFISCVKRDVCISNSTSCDGSPGCFNGYDEWNCDPSCPSSDIQTIPTSMPYSVISDNYPLAYGNDIECVWVLQAEAYHSLVIDIPNFYLEEDYDFFYIGLGHDRLLESGSLVVTLTGYIASTRYYLGIESYLYFYTDYSNGYSGFVLNVTSIPFELTESCDADQRVPVGSACNGVTDCVDDSDEFGCDNENPVISGCPSDQNVTRDNGNETALVIWTPPTATDNSGNQILTSTSNPGDYFPIGNNTVTYTSTDGAGNTETCTFILVVTDPMVNISLSVNEMYNLTSPGYPSNYDINLNLQWTVLAPSDYRVMISVTDFRSEAGYDYLHIGGGLTFDPDTWMVRFSGTYDSPTEVLLPGREAWILFFSDYSTTNVGFVLEITTSSEAAGECGASFISCVKRDVCISNSTSCDGSPGCFNGYDEWNCDPSCPSSDIQTIPTSMPYSVISDNYPLAYGNDIECVWVLQAEAYHSLVIDIPNFYLEEDYDFFYIGLGHDRLLESGSLVVTLTGYIASTRYYLGIESYLYFYTDYSNGYSGFVLNVTSIPFELTESCDADQRVPVGSACNGVTDCVDDSDEFGCEDEKPVINGCPSDQNVTTDFGNATAVVTWTPPTATDNSGNQTLTSSHNPGDYFPIGNNTVTYYARDYAGNTEACSFFVVVSDNENPVISGCPSDQNVTRDNGNETALVIWTPPTATDNSGNQTLTSTSNPGDYFPIGNNTVTYTSTDGAGNTETCTFILVVTDPMVNISLSVNEMYNLTSPGYPSNYDINLNLQWTVLAPSDYRVMISVTDFRSEAGYDYLHIGGGLTFDPDTWMVRFSGTYDSPTEVLLPGREAWILFFSDYSTTNVGFVLEITTSSEAAGECGASFISCLKRDVCISNSTSCDGSPGCFNGYDEWNCDPSCPSSDIQTIPTSMPYSVISDNYPLAYGNDIECVWVLQAEAYHSLVIDIPNFYLEEDYDFFYIGLGHDRLLESGSLVVTLTGYIASTRYYLGIESYLYFYTDYSNGYSGFVLNVTSIPFELTESCDADQRVPVGSACNGVTDCVDDSDEFGCEDEKPVINGCPSDQNVTTDFGNATAVVTWTPPTATDNSGNQTLTSSHNPGDYFPIGNNTVTYYARDYAGNTEACSFFVVVSDNENPVISGCPSDQNVTRDNGNETALVIWTPPTATDNSGNQTLTSTSNPGDYFPIGNNTVTYTSTDGAGNTETCTFILVVTDPMVNISLSVNEMYNLTSPGYPSNYDINLNLQWTVLAPSDYRVMISVTDFRSEAGYDYLHIGGGLTFDPDTWMVRFSGTYDSPTEVLLPGREAWILFFSDYITTDVGFVLEITTSSEAAGECGASFISCLKRDVCISNSTSCDGSPICFNGYDEWNCDPRCPSSDIQTIPTSMPYSVISDNYPLAYGNDIECIWVLQAEAYHSLVIDIPNFYLEDGYDFFYIGIGHDRSEPGSLVVRLTGYIASTRYYLGIESYLYFDTDYSNGYSGFVLNVTSIPFELTESCDADQRVPVGSACNGVTDCVDDSDEFGCVCQDDQFQCNGLCRPLSILCDGVMDCEDFSDEEDCPRCEPIQEGSCLGLLPFNQTYYPSSLADINQTLAIESFSVLSAAATTCHTDASLFLCAVLFPECIHDGPTARPCQTTCEAVRSACSSAFESLTGSPWAIACEEEFSNASPLNDGSLADGLLCRGPEGDITNTMICGTRPVFNEAVERIVGGEGSDLGEWPWIGSLSRGATNHQCGATVISREWAITVAHCVGAFDTITVGTISISNGNTSYQHTSSLEITSHPNFTSASGGDDIAVLKLVDPIPAFSDFLRPACLATVGDEINNYRTCYIAGWGHTTEGGSISNDLQQAVVGLIPDEYCGSAYGSFKADSMICAGYQAGGVDTCNGDSGGPLMCEGADGRWHLVGITSFGDGCARPNKPGVYTRVSQFIDFINSVVGQQDFL
ncbi:uncharacterized protein LOC105446087 isoform X3 [Strongylocentrotus purpuratus]|uniref:Hyalin n=1 Tax=Strongylocentrotus purpuratus TaxID=7668 RepID=A0A7M7N3S8_STRPU|nr:uncharacterized protein LOC105446087 isoform X3 [Strongylocentrotus purpuratus]